MPSTQSTLQSLQRIFQQNFSAHDITEALLSIEGSVDAIEVRDFMAERHLDVVGVTSGGRVVGYVQRDDLNSGVCEDHRLPFVDEQVIFDTAPLADVVLGLNESPRLFVSVFGAIGGIVTRSDLQKPAVRMWLFGMVTLVEMRMTRMIEESQIDWRQHLSAARLEKAESLLAERARRNQDLGLVDCLQFGDKAQIVAKEPTLRANTRIDTQRQVMIAAKKMQRLRNDLAHAQDIVATNWESLVDLATNLEQLLEGPPGLHKQAD